MITTEFKHRLKADLGKRIRGIHDDSDRVVSLGAKNVKVTGFTRRGRDFVEITVPDDWVVDTDEVLSRFKNPPRILRGWGFDENRGNGTVWVYSRLASERARRSALGE